MSTESEIVTPRSFFVVNRVSWGAIIAGFATAVAMEIVFVLLGAGLGFAIYHPITDDNPIADLSTGAIVVDGISTVISLWFGGWVAGRLSRSPVRTGWLHGFLVWASMMLAGVAMVGVGAGWALGDLSKLVGGGLSAAGKPLAAAVEAGGGAMKAGMQRGQDMIGSFVDEATSGLPDTTAKPAAIRAKREIGFAAGRYFLSTDEAKRAENRTALVKSLSDSGVAQADADRMVTQWTTSYDSLKADLAAAKKDAAEKARVKAEEAKRVLTFLSLGAFVAFVIGGFSAICGGFAGSHFAIRHEPLV